MGIIYQAQNTIDGILYIGQTSRAIRDRAREHCNDAKARRDNTHFHNAIRKYGCKAFEWRVLQEVDDSLLDSAEIYWIELALDQGFILYNLSTGGQNGGTMRGRNHSEATRQRMSEAATGRKGHDYTAEERSRMSESHKGKKFSEETRLKMSLARKAALERKKNSQ